MMDAVVALAPASGLTAGACAALNVSRASIYRRRAHLAQPLNMHGVTSGVNFTQTQRFEFPYDVVSASSPDPVEDATVLGPIKAKPLRVAAKTRPALTGPARGGCENWRSGWKNTRGAGRTKECAPRERKKRHFQTAGFQAISGWR
jgi:hypothetical protein